MLKSFGRWLATNPVVGTLVIALSIAGAVALAVALHLRWSEARGLISLNGRVRWHEFLIYAATLTAVIATLGGLLDCYKRRALTLETWWPRVRSGLLAASIPVWLSWIGLMLEKSGSGIYAKWVYQVNNHLGRVPRAILLVLAIAFVAWVVVVHVVVPAVKTFSSGGGE